MAPFDQERPEDLYTLSIQGVEDHLASLRYAGMIQHALMPDPDFMKGILRISLFSFFPETSSAEISIIHFQAASLHA